MAHTSSPSFSFLVFFFLLLSASAAPDTIHANQPIKDGQTIVSGGDVFQLGFFYLGIWYYNISTHNVVWVANRETPITHTSAIFKLSRQGNLLIIGDHNNVIWSSNSTVSISHLNPVAQLLDTGNLLVWDKTKSSTNQNLIWQSFDFPSDTILPGMKFGKDLVTGRERYITSWKSPDDPSPGLYSDRMDTNGYPQIFGWQGPVLLSRLEPWTGLGFSGFPIDIPNPIYSVEFTVNHKEIYHKYEQKGSVVQRVVLTWDGRTLQLHWIERIQKWVVYQDMAIDGCGLYARCGPYGICSSIKHPPCNCMEGFEPTFPKEWKTSDWSGGCRPKKPLKCGSGDGFRIISGVKLPDTQRSWYNVSMSLAECEMACRRNCSCTAYTNLDIRNGGSGCLLWFGELMDIREYEKHQDLYIRIPASELKGFDIYNNKKEVLTRVLISAAALLLSALAYACRILKKRQRMKGKGNWENAFGKQRTRAQMEHLDDIPFLSLQIVVKATDNFSVSNKIGEGGFGPVYKGMLEDGREIAVKRLSEKSKQGLDEFKNEVICIAKLQHRNLVKLLGYCIHGNEKILIYEYMPNKSLDTILFDETRSSMLDWPKRFDIIHGLARGILYLHQDSCLHPQRSQGSGYISPEYAVHGCFSIQSDVFSFGVIVLEIISGMKNREFTHEDHRDNLLGHAWRLHKEGKAIELIGASLRASCVISEVVRSIHVALLCVQDHAEDRPTMLSVVLMLVSDSALPSPKQPAFFTEEICREPEPVSSIREYMITLLYAR